MQRIIPATMRRPSSSPAALSFVLALAFLAQCSAFVLPPTPLAAASLRRQPHTVSKVLQPSLLFTRLCAPAAAAAAPVAPVGGSGSGLLPRLKTMAKNVVTGLPVIALSTISGGFLAGSLHSVTGTFGFLSIISYYTRFLFYFVSFAHSTSLNTHPHKGSTQSINFSFPASLPSSHFLQTSPNIPHKNKHIGPDHLAALLPRCIGKRWYQALRIGAVWGLGHGISAIIMGMVAFFLKGRLSSYSHSTLIPKLSLYTEVLIGVSLIIIGLLGLKEAASFEAPAVVMEADGTTAVASSSGTLKKVRFKHIVVVVIEQEMQCVSLPSLPLLSFSLI